MTGAPAPLGRDRGRSCVNAEATPAHVLRDELAHLALIARCVRLLQSRASVPAELTVRLPHLVAHMPVQVVQQVEADKLRPRLFRAVQQG